MIEMIAGMFKWVWNSLTFRFRSEDKRAEMWGSECARVMFAGVALASNDPRFSTWCELALHALEPRPNWTRVDAMEFSYGPVDVEFSRDQSVVDVARRVIDVEVSLMCASYTEPKRDALRSAARLGVDRFFADLDIASRRGALRGPG